MPAIFNLSDLPDARAERGSTRAKKKKLRYFFFAFLAFFAFAFFAFFAFLSHSILSRVQWLNATRGMLGGGPASQHPRLQTQQIRRPPAPRRHICVIALSTAQMRFRVIFAREIRLAARRDTSMRGCRRHG